MIRVLVVDDCVPTRNMVRAILEAAGCRVAEAGTAEDAFAALCQEPVDVLVSDVSLPGRNGVWLMGEAATRSLAGRIVAASGGAFVSGVDGLEAARQAGADHALSKPFPARTLVAAVLGTAAEK